MYRIESKISTKSTDFKENAKHLQGVVKEFKERLADAEKGGPPHAQEKHTSRGKLTARERLD